MIYMGLRACFDSPSDRSPWRAPKELRSVRGIWKKCAKNVIPFLTYLPIELVQGSIIEKRIINSTVLQILFIILKIISVESKESKESRRQEMKFGAQPYQLSCWRNGDGPGFRLSFTYFKKASFPISDPRSERGSEDPRIREALGGSWRLLA